MRANWMAALAAASMLCGCASASYVMDEYSSVEAKPFAMEGKKDFYRVFDKPAENKLMITPSIGRAAAAGFISGATFGGVAAEDNLGRKPEYEAATMAYLRSTGRDCRILDGYVVIKSQWEFKYDCSIPQRVAGKVK